MLDIVLPVMGIGGGIGIFATAVALGLRHGIDWDHIAAITDITSASSSVNDEGESWLIGEPGFMLTDESHHLHHSHARGSEQAHEHEREEDNALEARTGARDANGRATATLSHPRQGIEVLVNTLPQGQKEAVWLGSLYAFGHGTVVVLLGMLAIVTAEFLPSWVDPVMERVVGLTLLFLACYLFYSVYRYWRGGGEFRIRSRWMLVFAGVGNAWHWVRSRIGQHEHIHVQPQQYTARTAFGIGLIHGIGAETGTQALIIATAVGATSKGTAIAALLFFVFGLLISNTIVTLTSTFGFVSAQRRQAIYVGAGLVAAVFSLVVGLVFLTASTSLLPNLDHFTSWIGGPK